MPPYRRRNSAANRPPRPPPGTLRTFYRPSPPPVHPATRTPAGAAPSWAANWGIMIAVTPYNDAGPPPSGLPCRREVKPMVTTQRNFATANADAVADTDAQQQVAHLLRRAGFGATPAELESHCARGYHATVDWLLHPERQPGPDEDIIERYYIDWKESRNIEGALTETVYRMNDNAGRRPLQEKIALFWHGVFATGLAKVLHEKTMLNQIDLFRQHGLGNFDHLLRHLARDPAMIFWLDNNFNHKHAINENWGRELLELFAMGVGMDGQPNYAEDDVQAAARAFTGWTIDDDNVASIPYGKMPWRFRYDPADHDDGAKTFLGETGNFNGDDIIAIICRQPATARFISRHLYNFFVADEPPVPAWQDTPPADPDAVRRLEAEYFRSGYDIRAMLALLFRSDFFRAPAARFARVKSPAEVVVGALHLVGDFKFPRTGAMDAALECRYMNQDLLNPPSVEGWHTGKEWIDSGSMVERINFVADQLGNPSHPGVQDILTRVQTAAGPSPTGEAIITHCLQLLGCLTLRDDNRQALSAQATTLLHAGAGLEETTLNALRMIGATREYQFA